jgi:hypothetical protein
MTAATNGQSSIRSSKEEYGHEKQSGAVRFDSNDGGYKLLSGRLRHPAQRGSRTPTDVGGFPGCRSLKAPELI